ncbi:geranylgeranyl reductase family protein [Actinoplanes tereljensis]|uniref:Geranylgeranyl hydrogenase BchP n=1 Tax=Paractinoplanes tereljensis TaxID=571912 RepID=A0A919NRP0_9ACTN|nr:geranylgeranyl reductase family protein [Actinoplanes tereljensis]GIF22995.1 geranylgeranyl hydrogenase BchP [Actinoplanes tereljensis]
MPVDRFDVAVVGAGPAGAAAAIAACRAGARVLLLDRADFPRDKPCGDGVAAAAVAVLAELGVTGVTDGYPPIGRLRLVGPGGSTVARALPRPAHTVPRRVFDERLVRAAVAAGADLRRHTVRSIRDEGTGPLAVDGRAIRDDGAGPVVIDGRFAADVVIGADGAGSVVRRALGFPGNPPGHLAVAIRGYAPSENLDEQVIVTTEQRWPAYAWVFPIGDGTANVGYGEVLRGEPLSRAYLLGRLNDLLAVGAPTGLRGHHLPLSTRRPPPGRGRTLLAGDALSLINPFTGEGIFYAVLSGALAGAAAAAGPERVAERYRDALRRRLGRHLRHSGLAAWLTRRPSVVDAALSAAARDGRVFDRVVELGLEDGVLDLRTLGRITARLAGSRS